MSQTIGECERSRSEESRTQKETRGSSVSVWNGLAGPPGARLTGPHNWDNILTTTGSAKTIRTMKVPITNITSEDHLGTEAPEASPPPTAFWDIG